MIDELMRKLTLEKDSNREPKRLEKLGHVMQKATKPHYMKK